jgi:2-hydroxy-4-carboxymuconate semialdehyde hemiacetal dehydrogenase
MNVCMIGHGMMGQWHSETLATQPDCVLHTIVGRRPEPTLAFARLHGYRNATTDLDAALADPAIDVVVVASPSEQHFAMNMAALERGKHVLSEIPIGMSAHEADQIAEMAERGALRFGVGYPMRMMPDMLALHARLSSGAERLRLVSSYFIIKRWKNIGATGYRRSWTDNIMWHHLGHLIDFALWLSGSPVAEIHGFLPAPDPRTGTPMDAVAAARTEADQSLVFVGSYGGQRPVCESVVLTDRDCYRIDTVGSTLTTEAGTVTLRPEKEDCADTLLDLLEAVRSGRRPAITARDVLPAMRLMQLVQDGWDAAHGGRSVPGRAARR